MKHVLLIALLLMNAALAQRLPDIPPPLHPHDTQLTSQELAPNVYAILSGDAAIDNSGFIVGDKGVLVIDAHINGEMAGQIQSLVREVTDKPILYLVNTNYHGDHTFGNYAFPDETLIVAHEQTAAQMVHFGDELALIGATVGGDMNVVADVTLRLPDITFSDYASFDLGDRVVEVYHFGFGNTPGDTVVYEPTSQVAWTGNFILGQGSIPALFEGNAERYKRSVRQFQDTLDISQIVPGHGFMATADILERYEAYLNSLISEVQAALSQGQSLEALLAEMRGYEAFSVAQPGLPEGVIALFESVHRLNLEQTYQELSQ